MICLVARILRDRDLPSVGKYRNFSTGTEFDLGANMLIDRLLNQGSSPALEQLLRFTETRQRLMAEDVANIDTPGYIKKFLSPADFQDQLQKKIDRASESAPGSVDFSDIS